jgi:hypothetical protein
LALVALVVLVLQQVVMGLILYFQLLHQQAVAGVVEKGLVVVHPPAIQVVQAVVVVQQPGLAALEILHQLYQVRVTMEPLRW